MNSIQLVTVDEMKEIEQEANQMGISNEEMMSRAGRGIAGLILEKFVNHPHTALALVGSGNNGGDALIALTHLAENGWVTTAYLIGERRKEEKLTEAYSKIGGKIIFSDSDSSSQKLHSSLQNASLIIDGVLGTGIRLPLRPDTAKILDLVKKLRKDQIVIAVDCPSGIDCNTGEVSPETLTADLTICLQSVKIGLLSFPAFQYVGCLKAVDLELPDGMLSIQKIDTEMANQEKAVSMLPARPMNAHKGTFGFVSIIAGSVNYPGAALIASRAACMVGAGLVQAATPAPVQMMIAGHAPEVTWLVLPDDLGVISETGADILLKNMQKTTSLLIGPGLGQEGTTLNFLRKMFQGNLYSKSDSRIGFAQHVQHDINPIKSHLPSSIIDADALKLLAKIENWPGLLPENSLLTPHPGEMSTLSGLSVSDIQQNRMAVARKYSQEWNITLVLKGALSIIASPDGRVTVIPIATSALAKAGTGDALAGMIAGFLAQGLSPYDAAVTGSWFHAKAGQIAEKRVGCSASVQAMDVVNSISAALSLDNFSGN